MAKGVNLAIAIICISFLTLANGQCVGDVSLPGYYKDGAVFQAGSGAQVWGFTTTADCPVTVEQVCNGKVASPFKGRAYFEEAERQDDLLVWKLSLPGTASGTECTLTIAQAEQSMTLEIVYGDVWFCSGQSNMERKMSSILNATEEVAMSASYTNIRMFDVGNEVSDSPRDQIPSNSWDSWADASDSDKLNQFSAICFLYARYMYDQLGDSNKIFGLIESDWGGTRVEAWSSPDSLTACDVEDYVNEGAPQNSNSYLYNAMINPFLRHTIYGALWYQGESNCNWNTDLYACTFYGMIDDWRSKWTESNSGSNPDFPFGFVQLANHIGEPGGLRIRWQQTDYKGTVDGSVFMAVAMDTYDEEGGIHPRNKQIVGERLGITGGNIAYGLTGNPSNGPFPTFATNGAILTLEYPLDAGITYDNSEISGFYVCCEEYSTCDYENGRWTRIESQYVTADTVSGMVSVDYSAECPSSAPTGIAYMWEDTPVQGMLAAPIYSADEFRLPAAPWKFEF